MDNEIKIIEDWGIDNDGLQVYSATIKEINIVVSHKEKNINESLHLNVHIKNIQKVIEYLRNIEYEIEGIFFNMTVFQACGTYTLDIEFSENSDERLKEIILQYQKELKKDAYNFLRYYEFYKLGLQLELYAGPDDDMINAWNKNIEKMDILALKYNIYSDYNRVEDKYGADCLEDYILPKAYGFFKQIDLSKEENKSCKICKNCKHSKDVNLYYAYDEKLKPLNDVAYYCKQLDDIVGENDYCKYFKQK